MIGINEFKTTSLSVARICQALLDPVLWLTSCCLSPACQHPQPLPSQSNTASSAPSSANNKFPGWFGAVGLISIMYCSAFEAVKGAMRTRHALPRHWQNVDLGCAHTLSHIALHQPQKRRNREQKTTFQAT
jgi:hypothetical protein